jgi:hypothetical protein
MMSFAALTTTRLPPGTVCGQNGSRVLLARLLLDKVHAHNQCEQFAPAVPDRRRLNLGVRALNIKLMIDNGGYVCSSFF